MWTYLPLGLQCPYFTLNQSLSWEQKGCVAQNPSIHCCRCCVAAATVYGLLGKDHPPSAQNLSVYRAARRNHLARPPACLCPASRRPHRRQSPVTVTVTVNHPPCCSSPPSPLPPPRAHHLHRLHSPTARMRHHHNSVTTPSPLLEDPDPDLTAPIVDMSRPADGLPSQAGLDDNSGPNPRVNSHLSRDTITQHSATRPQDQDHFDSHRSRPSQKRSSSNSDSQATNLSSDESNRVFSPPMVETAASDGGPGSGQGSSQESQLFQLSQMAAVQDKFPGHAQPVRSAVKRTADGTVKDPRFSPTASPGRSASHSRNISAVSAASTASSRVTEVSSALDIPSRRFRHCRDFVSRD